MVRVYLFGNLGVLATTLIVFVTVWILFAVSGVQPNPTVAAPLYLALVLVGLVVGTVVGARRLETPAPNAEPLGLRGSARRSHRSRSRRRSRLWHPPQPGWACCSPICAHLGARAEGIARTLEGPLGEG